MSVQRMEYRVRWKREGRQQSTRIYQKHGSAWHKARGILALEAVKGDTSFHAMPDLEERPVIEGRPVGDWEPDEYQPGEPGALEKQAMLEWAEYTNPKNPDPEGVDVPF